MRFAPVLVLLALLLTGCPDSGAVKPEKPDTGGYQDEKKSIEQLRKERDEARARATAADGRADQLQKLIDQKETERWQARARWAAAGFLALAVLALVGAFYLPVGRKTLVTAAVALGLLGGACLLFAWLIPYLLWIGIGLAVVLAGVGAYLVRADHDDRQEAFAITARVAEKLGAGGADATRKATLFLEELAGAKRLNRAQLKKLRDAVLPPRDAPRA